MTTQKYINSYFIQKKHNVTSYLGHVFNYKFIQCIAIVYIKVRNDLNQ